MNKVLGILAVLVLLLMASCSTNKTESPKSDSQSEAMLDGIWLDSDDGEVAFKAVGDTLYYPESDIVPVHFRIYGDTIYIDGAEPMKYYIEKFTPHIFQFRNQNGESVKLIKSDDPNAENAFKEQEETIDDEDIIQELVKRDSIVYVGDKRLHCYVQINPTTYKVMKTDYNTDGVGVSKVYYDNIINVCVIDGDRKIFTKNFYKQDFKKYVPKDMMKQCILSDIDFDHTDNTGVVFGASLRIPESASSYLVYITITPYGKYSFSQPQ